ncbi:MAG: hypothetical protein J6Q84_01310 [Kiritimatiellae bacterium]|nr:hypothetical protein [Kiritimatiellia bacterium]
MLNSFRFILAGVIVLISSVSLSVEYYVDSINGDVCRDAGFGWGYDQRPDINGAHLLFYENKAITENFVVRNNTFINARNWTVRMENDWRKSLRIENNRIRSLPGVPVIRWITGMHEAFFDIDGFKALGFN